MRNTYKSILAPNAEVLEELRDLAKKVATFPENTQYYKTIKPVNADEIINKCAKAAEFLAKYHNLVIIGMGGAVNNPKTIFSALGEKSVHYLNTTDPYYLTSKLEELDLREAAFLMISNSGQTTENISIFATLLHIDPSICNRSVFLVGDTDNTLRAIAKKYKIMKIFHDPNIGGRFSGFSEVIALPLMARGYDAKAFLEGSSNLAQLFAEENSELLATLSLSVERTMPNSVLLCYSNRLKDYLEWYSQAFGESLGKDKKGVYPIVGIGPQDQHSMLQLYLGGPDTSFYTVVEVISDNHFMTAKFDRDHPLAGRNIADIHQALCVATIQTLDAQDKPLRHITVNKLDEASIGELMMFAALEVVCLANRLKVNPFDQPAVELIKIRTRTLLNKDEKVTA